MASSLDNTNKLKIAGIGENLQKGYMKNLNEKLGVSLHHLSYFFFIFFLN